MLVEPCFDPSLEISPYRYSDLPVDCRISVSPEFLAKGGPRRVFDPRPGRFRRDARTRQRTWLDRRRQAAAAGVVTPRCRVSVPLKSNEEGAVLLSSDQVKGNTQSERSAKRSRYSRLHAMPTISYGNMWALHHVGIYIATSISVFTLATSIS